MSEDLAPKDYRESGSEQDDNPFKPPATAASSGQASSAENPQDGASFAHQAARFSLYAPVLLVTTNLIVRESLGANHPGAKGFAILSLLTIAAAFFLGIVGMIGGVKQLAFWSAFVGLFGTLLNGIILAAVVRLLI